MKVNKTVISKCLSNCMWSTIMWKVCQIIKSKINNATNREAGALFLLLWTKAVVRTTV